ncbi:hypothetical protein IMSHALPRED_000731 [Imshaugia aleurites]|uniref:Uncharacterized protein n=1 Tax=Imshaugia aleurites TaxID=172621 RepID=A0A8H3GDD0_9LECA|nr:hypothetical protein IMSHALPRED_000731 [Imshaugia aleurites]
MVSRDSGTHTIHAPKSRIQLDGGGASERERLPLFLFYNPYGPQEIDDPDLELNNDELISSHEFKPSDKIRRYLSKTLTPPLMITDARHVLEASESSSIANHVGQKHGRNSGEENSAHAKRFREKESFGDVISSTRKRGFRRRFNQLETSVFDC